MHPASPPAGDSPSSSPAPPPPHACASMRPHALTHTPARRAAPGTAPPCRLPPIRPPPPSHAAATTFECTAQAAPPHLLREPPRPGPAPTPSRPSPPPPQQHAEVLPPEEPYPSRCHGPRGACVHALGPSAPQPVSRRHALPPPLAGCNALHGTGTRMFAPFIRPQAFAYSSELLPPSPLRCDACWAMGEGLRALLWWRSACVGLRRASSCAVAAFVTRGHATRAICGLRIANGCRRH